MIDLRTKRTTGRSFLAYDQEGVRICLGDWIMVEFMGTHIKFDNEDLGWTDHELNKEGQTSVLLLKEALSVFCRRATPGLMLALIKHASESYALGLKHGKQYQTDRLREVLGL